MHFFFLFQEKENQSLVAKIGSLQEEVFETFFIYLFNLKEITSLNGHNYCKY